MHLQVFKHSFLALTLALLLVLSSANVYAQEASTCVTKEQYASLRESVLSQHAQFQDYAKQYALLLQQKADVLKLIEACQAEDRTLEDMTDTFSLQTTKCNKLIQRHNLLDTKADNLKVLLSTQQSIVQAGVMNLKLSKSSLCDK